MFLIKNKSSKLISKQENAEQQKDKNNLEATMTFMVFLGIMTAMSQHNIRKKQIKNM